MADDPIELTQGLDDYARLLRDVTDLTLPNNLRFESLCALEQTLSDFSMLQGNARNKLSTVIRRLTIYVARHSGSLIDSRGVPVLASHDPEMEEIGLPNPLILKSWVVESWRQLSEQTRRRLSASSGFGTRWADCLGPNPIDFGRYLAAARKVLSHYKPQVCLVVGIRTSGSYLAPIWAHALDELGSQSAYFTVRPVRSENGDIAVPEALDRLPLDDVTDILLVDDGAFSGQTLENVERSFGSLKGVRIRSCVYLVSNQTSSRERRSRSDRLILRGCHRLLPFFGDVDESSFFSSAAGSIADFEVVPGSIELCGPSYWQSYVLGYVDIPADVVTGLDHRIRKRRYRLVLRDTNSGQETHTIAKYIGWGPLVGKEARVLRERCSDSLIGTAAGYVFIRWMSGYPTEFRGGWDWVQGDILSIARNYAVLTKSGRFRMGNSDEWDARRKRVGQRLSPLSEKMAEAYLGQKQAGFDFPVVTVARNQGHWHYVRVSDGTLRRFHQDIGRWFRRVDPAWEIASSILELGFNENQTELLLSECIEATSDSTLRERLPLAVAEYAISVLDEFMEHHERVLDIPTRFLREEHSVTRPVLDRVEGMLAIVPAWLGIADPIRINVREMQRIRSLSRKPPDRLAY